MKTTFTFKGFELSVKEADKKHNNEHIFVKVDEISTTVEDLNLKEYSEILFRLPKLVREIGEAFIEVEHKQHEFEMNVLNNHKLSESSKYDSNTSDK